MDRLRRYTVIIVTFFILLQNVCACTGNSDYFGYTKKELTGEISGSLHGIKYSASIRISAPHEHQSDTSAPDSFYGRDITIKYSSPDSLKDISLQVAGDLTRLELNGLEVPASEKAIKELISPAVLLCSAGIYISEAVENGCLVLTLTDGTRIVIDPQSDLPKEIITADGEVSVNVEWLEAR